MLQLTQKLIIKTKQTLVELSSGAYSHFDRFKDGLTVINYSGIQSSEFTGG